MIEEKTPARSPASQLPIRLATFVTAIFVPVLVFDADLHATARPIFVIVVAVVPTWVRAIPASSIVPIAVSIAILIAFAIIITVTVSSPFRTRVTVFPAHTLAVAAAHPPIATDFTVVLRGSAALGTLLPLLLGIWSGWLGAVCGAAIVGFSAS